MVIFYTIVGVMFFAGALLGFLFCMLRKESSQSISIQPLMPAGMKEPGFQKHVEDLEKENEKLKTEAQQGRGELLAANAEITKHRAQAFGFERMCDNYKVQLEQALGRVGAMEKDQIELQATKNRLEKSKLLPEGQSEGP